jgi:hypothetical protein
VFQGSTLFLDVGAQRDLWPGGIWPLIDADGAGEVATLCALGRTLGVRQGGIMCRHPGTAGDLPAHCLRDAPGAARVPGCEPALPVRVVEPDGSAAPLDRARALYVASGCSAAIDGTPATRAAFDHLTAGVRDAVVFGAGIELGIAHAVEALLQRRIRTHLVLDASGAADPGRAQELIAVWKRRLLDVTTTATIARLLRAA